MKNKILSIILILSLVIPFCCACAKTETSKKKNKKDKKETVSEISEDMEETEISDDGEEPEDTEETEEPATTKSAIVAIRSDISAALTDHPAIEDAIRNGRLHEVSFVDKGMNSPYTFTFDSFLADEVSFCFFTKLDGNIPDDGTLMLQHAVMTDADTGEELQTAVWYPYYEESGRLEFSQFYWEKPCTNFDLDIDLLWQDADYYTQVIESYHFEFRDVDITPSKVMSIDQDVSVLGHDIHVRELRAGETGTLLVYDDPLYSDLFTLDAYVLSGSDLLAQCDPNSIQSFSFFDKDGSRIWFNSMNSFYFSSAEDIEVVIDSYTGAFSDGNYIRIDPRSKTAEYLGNPVPVEVYGFNSSYSDFGLPANDYMDDMDSYIFLIPSEGLPEFNSTFDIHLHTFSYNGENYPHITKDGKDYFVIQIPDYLADNEDGFYYLAEGTASECIFIGEQIPLKVSDAKPF